MEARSVRLTLYLFCGLLGLLLSGLIPNALLGETILLLFCILPVFYERKRGETPFFPFRPCRMLSSLLFFPLLLGVTIGVSALTALLFPTVVPAARGLSVLTVLTSAIAPALAEETLFRFLTLSILLPYGKKRAVVLSAFLFALFHQSLYQMPYALAAGVVLGAAALYSNSVTLPVLLHFANNLLSLLIGARLTLPLVLIFVLLGALAAVALYVINHSQKNTKSVVTPTRAAALFPLSLYAVYCLTMAVLRL